MPYKPPRRTIYLDDKTWNKVAIEAKRDGLSIAGWIRFLILRTIQKSSTRLAIPNRIR